MKKRRLAIAAAIGLSLSGCLGGMFEGYGKFTRSRNEVGLSEDRGEAFCGRYSPSNLRKPSRERIVSMWGEPDSIRSEGDVETWLYRGERRWSGLVLFLVIPIPLYVPSGWRETMFEFHNGELAVVHGVAPIVDAAACGFGLGPGGLHRAPSPFVPGCQYVRYSDCGESE